MNIVAGLLSLPHRPVRSTTDVGDARAGATKPAQADGDRPPGCFDSSGEHSHGRVAREHATPDALAAELPLASRIELHLVLWRGAGPSQGILMAPEAPCGSCPPTPETPDESSLECDAATRHLAGRLRWRHRSHPGAGAVGQSQQRPRGAGDSLRKDR